MARLIRRPYANEEYSLKRAAKEELLNAATHGVGFLLSVAGAGWLMWRLMQTDSLPLAVPLTCAIYCLSLMGLYLMSTLSHVLMQEPWHSRFRRLDQGFIYLLILGTYSPLAALFLKSTVAWIIFGGMWALAILGCVSKIFFSHRVERVSIWIYVLLGWGPALIGLPLDFERLKIAYCWMAAGGIVYCLGLIFLLQDKRWWYFHGIWHLFVIGGSAIHFFGVVEFLFGNQAS